MSHARVERELRRSLNATIADSRSQLAAREAELEEAYKRCAQLELQLQSRARGCMCGMQEVGKTDRGKVTPTIPTSTKFVPKFPPRANGGQPHVVLSEEEQQALHEAAEREQAVLEAEWAERCLQEVLELEELQREMEFEDPCEPFDD